MNNDTKILLGATAVGAYLLYQGKKAANTVKQLSVVVTGLKFKSMGIFQSQIEIQLNVYNPTFNAVAFEGFQCTLQVQGSNLASVPNFQPSGGISFQPGYTPLSIPVTINHINVAANLYYLVTAWLGGNFGQDITIIGTLKAGGIQVPISKTMKLNSILPAPAPSGPYGTGTGILPGDGTYSGGVPLVIQQRPVNPTPLPSPFASETVFNRYNTGKAAVNGIGCNCSTIYN